MRGAGDQDQDGVPDVLVGYLDRAPIYNTIGYIEVYSGATGAVIHHFDPVPYLHAGFGGGEVRADRDLNGDGVNEIVIGDGAASSLLYLNGSVDCRDGRTGQLLWREVGTYDYAAFGQSLALVGDVNGDGIGDVAVARSRG